MKIIKQSFEIFEQPKPEEQLKVLQHIERAGRVCYKSEDKITDDSCRRFVESIRNRGHWSVLEHYSFSLWIPELSYMRFQSLVEDHDDPVLEFYLKFIKLSRVPFPKEENKEFLLTLSATSINYIWNYKEAAIFDEFIDNVFKFIAIDYPELIKVPDRIDISDKRKSDNILYSKKEEIIEADLHHFHIFITVQMTTSRSIANEVVRHRVASYSQASTRYCNYSNDKFDNQISVIDNDHIKHDSEEYEMWKKTLQISEIAYMELINKGVKPELARDILSLSLSTELFMSASIFEWQHFMKMRMSNAAHPQIRELATRINNELSKQYPDIFIERIQDEL